MTQSPQDNPPFEVAAFLDRWAKHRHLNVDQLYALPAALIDRIKEVLPKFFTRDDAEFETDLANCGGHGISSGNVFHYDLLDPDKAERQGGPPAIVAATDSIDAMLLEHKLTHGWNAAELEAEKRKQQKHQSWATAWAAGYAGWLVTEQRFRTELEALRGNWTVEQKRYGFRHIPLMAFGREDEASDVPSDMRPYYAAMTQFYRRWSLERLITWDLPLPLRANLLTQHIYNPVGLAEAGVNLFLPMYLIKDKGISMKDIVRFALKARGALHLQGWLETPGVGAKRFRRMLQLFVYLRLALQRRYPNKLHGGLEQLDVAFGRCFEVSEDSIKKLRLMMERRIGKQT